MTGDLDFIKGKLENLRFTLAFTLPEKMRKRNGEKTLLLVARLKRVTSLSLLT